ncbi:MAG: helix-turn-helix domain-containing protein [Candidatus Merdivicinus sp.]
MDSIDIKNYNESGESIYKIKDMIAVLSSIKDENASVSSVYYIDAKKNYMITSDGEFSILSDYKGMNNLEEISQFQKTTILNTNVFLKSSITNQFTSQYTPCITLACPIRQYQSSHQQLLLINIKEESINQYLLQNRMYVEGDTFIIDEEGKMVSGIWKEFLGKSLTGYSYINKILTSEANTGYIHYESQDESRIVSFLKSELFPWTYINMQPITTFEISITRMWTTLWIIIVILSLIGMLLAYFISEKLYQPVGNIVHLLDDKLSTIKFKDKNELKLITHLVEDITQNEREIKEILEKNQADLRKLAFLRAVSGGYSREKDQERIILKEYFVCLLFSINTHTSVVENCKLDFRYVFIQECETIITKYMDGYAVLLNNGDIAAVIYTDTANAHKIFEVIQKIYAELIQRFGEQESDPFYLGVGEVYRDPSQIQASFLEAKEALQYQLISRSNAPIYYFEIQDRDQEYMYPESNITRLCNYMESNDEQGFAEELSNIMLLIRQSHLSYDNIIYILYQILGEIVNYLLSCNIQTSQIFQNSSEIFQNVTEFYNLDEIYSWFLDVFRKISSYQNTNEQFKQKYFHAIEAIISDHYDKGDLDLSYVAEKVGLSYSHLRKKFKEYFHCSFPDYVNQKRILKAKELLLHTDDTIEMISDAVGFISYQAFSRAFKKAEGITPGQYRENQAHKA